MSSFKPYKANWPSLKLQPSSSELSEWRLTVSEMVECCACGSGTYEPIVEHSPIGKCDTYCLRCYKVFVKVQGEACG